MLCFDLSVDFIGMVTLHGQNLRDFSVMPRLGSLPLHDLQI